MIKPYAWQQSSVDRLLSILTDGNFAVNTSDTGTGKTVVALEVMKRLGLRTLIICPKAVHTAWRRTAEAMDCSDLILGIINPEKLQHKNEYFNTKTKRWVLPKDTFVIWDEVHRGASGIKSRTTQICAYLKPQGYKVLVMSATVANSPLQMRAVGYRCSFSPVPGCVTS